MDAIEEYEALARETGAYKEIEVEILKEAIESWARKPKDPYDVLAIRDGKVLAAFLVMCRESGSEYSYSVQTVCVDPSYRDTGVVAKLLAMAEEEVLEQGESAIIRFELSSEKESALGHGSLVAHGYSLIGHIKNFYAPGSDYFMFAKHINRNGEQP
jgi:ribosomal protein S18 acetylase RimI-like enzyme